MIKTIHVHRCLCGRNAVSEGLLEGYPALHCKHCGKRWWYTTCFKNHNHVIDSRFAKKCVQCGWYHCQICSACRPSTQPDEVCGCSGDCEATDDLTIDDMTSTSDDLT